jgi:hypothetical protein
MRALYDSQVNALSIDLLDAEAWDGSEEIDETYCRVALAGGRPVDVELLDPDRHLGLLAVAAERLGLDRQALEAAARAALSAPDRVVTVDVAAGVAA